MVRVTCVATWLSLSCISATSTAIDFLPAPAQIEKAIERGKAAASNRTPPDRLYVWFGGNKESDPKGFLMTKFAGLSVMSAHFALRGETPTETDIRQILDDPGLLISVTLVGDHEALAVDSYMLLFQGDRTIKPTRVRFDARGTRTPAWPRHPAYQAKVIASFPYAELVPDAKTRLSIFPASGGEVSFDLDFSDIE